MMEPCKLGQCDGSGMLDIRILKTVVRYPNGSIGVKKQVLTHDQAEDLKTKIDWKDQTIVEAAKPCGCKSL